MTRPARRDQRGFTLLEMMAGTGLFLMMMAGFGQVFDRSSGVAHQSFATVRAHEEHDRNLRAIADLLRGTAWDTLTGFAEDGTSTAPGFQRVLGSDAEGRILDDDETLSWRPSGKTVYGVSKPGELVLKKHGSPTVIAARVPAGGFVVRQTGNTLKVTLQTYYSASNGVVATVTGDVSVSLRN